MSGATPGMISEFGGLSKVMPIFAVFFMIVTLSSIGLPGTNGFVGEFLILLGAFQSNIVYGVLATTGVVLGAAYMLWMFQRVMFGKITKPGEREAEGPQCPGDHGPCPDGHHDLPHGDLSQTLLQQDGCDRRKVFEGFQGKS